MVHLCAAPQALKGTPPHTEIRTLLDSHFLHDPSLKELQSFCASSD